MRTDKRVDAVQVLALVGLFITVTILLLAVVKYLQPEPQEAAPAPVTEAEPLQAWSFVVPAVAPEVLLTCVEPEPADPEPADPAPYIPVLELVEAWVPDEADVHAIARTMWGECRGVSSKAEQAAVAWCIMNRLDAGYADTVTGVCAAPGQFAGYSASHPLDDELVELARDVLIRHHREAEGEALVGRTLPSDYYYFTGRDGRNWFREGYRSGTYWDWSLPDPYKEG